MWFEGIHPTAIVHDSAIIGAGSSVGPYSVIGPQVRMGPNNRIGSHVVLEGDTWLGEGNQIYQFASVGAQPQDLKFLGGTSRLEIGDNNILREYVTVQPGLEQFGGVTRLGSNNLLMACCHVAHDCVIGNHNWITNSAALGGHSTVGNHVIFGGLSGIHQFCRVGDHAFLGAGSMVSQDVPPFCIVQGDRARLVTINRVGLERGGFSAEDIARLNTVFKAIFVRPGKFEEKIEAAFQAHGDFEPAMRLIDFLRASKRGIVSYRRAAKGEE